MPPRVAFVFTHRIQYFANLLDELHRGGRIEPVAIYAHRTEGFTDRGFGKRISWDNRPGTAFREVLLPHSGTRRHGGFFRSFDTALRAALDGLRPACVHLNGYAQAIQWQVWLWARGRRIPILARGDGDTLGPGAGRRSKLRNVPALIFTRWADHVFFQGEENRKYWLSRGASPGKMSWLPCVSDTAVFHRSAFQDEASRRMFRQVNGADPHDVVFVVSGKLEARKRPSDALHMLAQNPTKEIKVWFLGSGPLESELKALAGALGVAARVHWWGFRNQTDMPPILQAADVLLHLSEADPWPYSVLDGAASGLALLLSDRTGSHPDWAGAPSACRVFPCGNVNELVRAACALHGDAALRVQLQQAATAKCARYTESEFRDRIEPVILRLTSGFGGSASKAKLTIT